MSDTFTRQLIERERAARPRRQIAVFDSGIGGLGTWFTEGYQANKSDQIIAGIIAIFVLAIVIDTLIMLAGRALTPWTRASRTPKVRPKATAEAAA